MFSAYSHAFVNLYPEPFERLDDVLLGSRHESVAVGVLDTEQHLAAVLSCEQVVVKGSSHASDMQCASWTWRESYSNV